MKKIYNDFYIVKRTIKFAFDKSNDNKWVDDILSFYSNIENTNRLIIFPSKFYLVKQSLDSAHKNIILFTQSTKIYGINCTTKDNIQITYDKQNIPTIEINNKKKRFIEVSCSYNYYLYYNDVEIKDSFLTSVLEKYKPPYNLDPLYLVKNPEKNMCDYDLGLVYVGKDKRNKTQYIYGIEYVQQRYHKKLDVFIKVHKNLDKIKEYIQKNLPTNRNKITQINLMAVLLLLEFNTFIRTGRDVYNKNNNTEGILTMKTSSVTIKNTKQNKTLIINFIGKKQVPQYFTIENDVLVNMLSMIYNKDNEFLFTDSSGKRLQENIFYRELNKLNITLKNIRTYGVNRQMLENIYTTIVSIDDSNFKNNTKENEKIVKNIIKSVIEETADAIGHSYEISKSSYISDEIVDFISRNYTNFKYKTLVSFIISESDFEQFIEYIIKHVSKSNNR